MRLPTTLLVAWILIAGTLSGTGPRISAAATDNGNSASFIDRLIARKLVRLNIPTSPRSSDGEFLRRAFLDACGILPSVAEAEAFLNDRDPRKRERLIESVLAREEFTDYVTYRWCDLLLVSSRKLNARSMWSLYHWIRQSVKADKPWDQVVREILTATGSNFENGAANYFVLHKETIDLAETTTQAFLGMSMMCARCHNHPLEKWTNQDYYGFANLFARVALKNGDANGETLVLTIPTGEVIHPRLGRALPPRPLDGQPVPLDAAVDRRRVLADWLTSPVNPYFARALVNRVWRHFMGRGLVEREDDLRLTNPPTNPQLLDALVKDFVEHRFSVRHLVRTIMSTEAYQRTSIPVPGNEQDDRYYSHFLVRRLPAEVLLDAFSQVTGTPTEFSGYPAGTRALQLPDSKVGSAFLDAFGRPAREQTCSCERQEEPSVQQALHLSNGDTVNEKARKSPVLESMIKEQTGNEEVLDRLFLAALCRRPLPGERTRMLDLLQTVGDDPSLRRQAMEDLYVAVLTSPEFLFDH